VYKSNAVIHYNLRRKIACIPSTQPSSNDLGKLGAAAMMKAIGKPPHSVVTCVHCLFDFLMG
jgi:hypothetical protein